MEAYLDFVSAVWWQVKMACHSNPLNCDWGVEIALCEYRHELYCKLYRQGQ